jgi:Icc-related predicted phosphoesterase
VVELTESTGLIGHGGWADGRLGLGQRSQVVLNDYVHIGEFVGLGQEERFRQLNTLGDQAAEYFRNLLPTAAERFPNLLLLTHVPPFREACWHEGRVSDDEYLPHFASWAVGEVLAEVMSGFPESDLTVLCGHTHSDGEVKIAPNLHVRTGGAVYGRPQVQELIVVG